MGPPQQWAHQCRRFCAAFPWNWGSSPQVIRLAVPGSKRLPMRLRARSTGSSWQITVFRLHIPTMRLVKTVICKCVQLLTVAYVDSSPWVHWMLRLMDKLHNQKGYMDFFVMSRRSLYTTMHISYPGGCRSPPLYEARQWWLALVLMVRNEAVCIWNCNCTDPNYILK